MYTPQRFASPFQNVELSQSPPRLSINSNQYSPIKGESRFEYYPIERSYIEYEEQRIKHYVPVEKTVTDYYQIEHITEYFPYTIQEKYTEYVPVERIQERVEYTAVERQIIHYPTDVALSLPPPQPQYNSILTPPRQATYQSPINNDFLSRPDPFSTPNEFPAYTVPFGGK